MQFIDTHTHLYLEEFDKDREEVINNAVKAGTTKMIIPNIDRSSFKPMLKLCNDFHGICYPCVGLHPSSVKADFHEELAEIEKQLKQNKFFAIGETGMDLYWDITYWREQKEALTFHFDLALKHNLPVIIHSRESYKEISEVLEDFKTSKLKGVFHCFSGDVNEADEIIQKGFLLGIGGVVTYKNSQLQKTIKEIDLGYIVLETDSPYLPPVPFRGKRNESAYLIYIAEKIAEIKGISVEEVANITTRNAKILFQI